MRILIGTTEIAGWIYQFKHAFEELGHEVTTAVIHKHVFYPQYSYDVILDDEFKKFRFKKELKKQQYFYRILRKINDKIADYKYNKFLYNLFDSHDLVIQIWTPFLPYSKDHKYFKKKKIKFVQLFVGSDVRYYQSFKQQFDISQWEFPQYFKNRSVEEHLRLLRTAEKYADIIYSVPDQAGLQLRPYFHLQVPVSVKGTKFQNNKRLIPKVLHAPSMPFKKGTDIIEKTLKLLMDNGIEFDLISVRDLPQKKVLELLTDSDILIDEIVNHGPGTLSFEAMLSGCAVATRYLETSPPVFRPPLCAIDANNIYEKLFELITNYELRNSLIEKGREYALKNNEAIIVAKGIINDLEKKREYDYIPFFLRNNYLPTDKNEMKLINKWNEYVKKCSWYKKYVPKGYRMGLKF